MAPIFLGVALLRLGRITQQQLDRALEEQESLDRAGRHRRLGSILVGQGAITGDQLRDALEQQGLTAVRCAACAQPFDPVAFYAEEASSCPACRATAFSAPAAHAVTAVGHDGSHATGTSLPEGGSDATRTGAGPGTRPRSAPVPLAEGDAFGRYRLLRRLGEGGMGVVWLAQDADLEREVALKQIKPGHAADGAQMSRFLREARLAARLRHPHIVGVYDVGCEDGVYYMTMEHVRGRTLSAFLRDRAEAKAAGSRGGLDRLRDEIRILAEVAEAVGCAHRAPS